jgi:g-D-glutamyl-meso-diaminopimelate peptidase
MADLHKIGMDIVRHDIGLTSETLGLYARRLQARYPFLDLYPAGLSVLGRELLVLRIGEGPRELFINGAHHANEWLTALLLMRFAEDYLKAVASSGDLGSLDARWLCKATSLYLMPLVNPDGADLVAGALPVSCLNSARLLSASNPGVPFPAGWKANIRGVDLNLQYPTGWEKAKEIKASLGIAGPGPRDWPGCSPLSEPESRAVYDFTLSHDFLLTLSFHTQGKVIYWKYLDYEPKNSYRIAGEFRNLSGYSLEETPEVSGYAGYKDWFISAYNRPGYTVEAGEGVSPLPLSQLSEIYDNCLGILTHSLLTAALFDGAGT